MHTQGYGRTDVGRSRQNNEDSFLVDDALGLYVVSDGMGGHAGGEVASAAAVEAVRKQVTRVHAVLEEVRSGAGDVRDAERLVAAAVAAANRAVLKVGAVQPELHGLACTLTVLLVVGEHAVIGHVGDSRLYLHRGGETVQLTEDHTVAYELYLEGQMSLEAARTSVYSNMLTRGIGVSAALDMDLFSLRIRPGDRFLVCSDGLTRYLPDAAWLSGQLGRDDVSRAPDALVAHANAQGGADNVTAVVVGIPPAVVEARRADPDRGGQTEARRSRGAPIAAPLWRVALGVLWM